MVDRYKLSAILEGVDLGPTAAKLGCMGEGTPQMGLSY